eukprot:m.102092 g.102092  ORF g.102092 m.102092 type:complete len:154 (+) comp51529_c0_seq4:50-511(+)
MRHGVAFRRLGRPTDSRNALLRALATQLLKYERICTTLPKAKELRRVADRMVTLGKDGSELARRKASSFVYDQTLVPKLFGDFAKRYSQRAGGYTRVLRCGFRKGDGAPLAYIEYVDNPLPSLRPAPLSQEDIDKIASGKIGKPANRAPRPIY